MHLTTYQYVHDYLEVTQPLFEADEVRFSLPLGIAKSLLTDNDQHTSAFLATIEEHGRVMLTINMGANLSMLMLSQISEVSERALRFLVHELVTSKRRVKAVEATDDLALSFAEIWQQETGNTFQLFKHSRLHQLSEVVFPATQPGRLRLARLDEGGILSGWAKAFMLEEFASQPVYLIGLEALVQRNIREKTWYVWESLEGKPVSMARLVRPLKQCVSIGYVYTPPAERGKTYASQIVAALSQQILDQGWPICALFTDVNNPVSNKIYHRLGYRPVCDFTSYDFIEHPG